MKNIPPNCTRKIRFSAYKPSGKWYATGSAYVDPDVHYWENQDLLQIIDQTNDQLVDGAISSGQYYIVIEDDGGERVPSWHFLLRLIPPMV